MIEFSAKQLHENPSKVYRAANREPVVITHRYHGEMVLMSKERLAGGVSIGVAGYVEPQCIEIKVSDMDLHIQHTTAKETGAPE